MIEGVIFDFDGVIVDSEPFWEEAKIKVFNTAGYNMTSELVSKSIGKRIELIAAYRLQAKGGISTLKDLLKARSLGVTRVGATAAAAILDEANTKL